ncbi:hypothetical protein PHMEG_00015062 [Phytophthora megakarya]|uniref:Uncharacterized protein n=1 Tax=Phytophthora megakarya TaxID=4795 RepID=A0A225W3S9_9STRA|nr:hypothetical protein PHMEG_00015062 [Phytophthora megakarya]
MSPPSNRSPPSTAQFPSAPSGVDNLAGTSSSGDGSNDAERSPPHRALASPDCDECMREGGDATIDVLNIGAYMDITARVVNRFLHQSSGHACFVGIPAWPQHLAEDKYSCDRYGGLEVVPCVYGLTAVDLRDLATLVDQNSDVDDLTLRLRADRPLTWQTWRAFLTRPCGGKWSHRSPDMLDAQGETTRVKVDYTTLHEFYWAEYELETRALREEVAELHSQVDNLRLLGRSRSGARRLDVPRLMNFSNRDQTRVNDNWKRLQNLHERFHDGGTPQISWNTLIAVTAVNDPFAQTSPFVSLPENDCDYEENDHSGDRGGNNQGGGNPGGNNNEVDLTQPDSDIPDSLQLRPAGWAPTQDEARSLWVRVMFSKAQVRDTMKNEPVAWDSFCPDVVLVMQAGIGYQGDIAIFSGDVMTHNLFSPSAFAEMVVSMMFRNRLDDSLWAKYDPDRYYLRAELRLTDTHSEGNRPEFWPDLIEADVRDAQDAIDDASSEHDDLPWDGTYNPDEDVDVQDDNDIQGSQDPVPAAKQEAHEENALADVALPKRKAAKEENESVTNREEPSPESAVQGAHQATEDADIEVGPRQEESSILTSLSSPARRMDEVVSIVDSPAQASVGGAVKVGPPSEDRVSDTHQPVIDVESLEETVTIEEEVSVIQDEPSRMSVVLDVSSPTLSVDSGSQETQKNVAQAKAYVAGQLRR